MALTFESKPRTEFKIPSEGPTVGTVYRIIDLGSQAVEYKGESKVVKQVVLFFELPNEMTDDGRPLSISRVYTASLGEKSALRPVVRDLTQKPVPENFNGFDLSCLIGCSGVIDIVHRPSKDGSKMYANVQSISKIMKGTSIPPMHNEPLVFDLDPSKYSDETFNKLPEYYRKKIQDSTDWAKLMDSIKESQTTVEATESDIPF